MSFDPLPPFVILFSWCFLVFDVYNVRCIKIRTKLSNVLVLCLVRFLMHQTSTLDVSGDLLSEQVCPNSGNSQKISCHIFGLIKLQWLTGYF